MTLRGMRFRVRLTLSANPERTVLREIKGHHTLNLLDLGAKLHYFRSRRISDGLLNSLIIVRHLSYHLSRHTQLWGIAPFPIIGQRKLSEV